MDFVKHLKKIIKQIGFHVTFKTAYLQYFVYTSLGDNIKVNSDKLFLHSPIFFSDTQTQIMFNDCNEKSFTSSFDPWSTVRKTVDTQLGYQIDIGSAQNIRSPKYLIVALQTAVTIGTRNEAVNVAVFDNLIEDFKSIILIQRKINNLKNIEVPLIMQDCF